MFACVCIVATPQLTIVCVFLILGCIFGCYCFAELDIKLVAIILSAVKFDDCMGNDAVVFQSSDPIFSVRTDGSVFVQAEGASLDEPVQFKLTASGPHTHAWETVVQLAMIDLPSTEQNEVSYAQKYHALNFNYHLRGSSSYHIFSRGLVIVTAQNQVITPWGFYR